MQKEAANRSSSNDGEFCTPSITISAAETFEARVVGHLREKVKLNSGFWCHGFMFWLDRVDLNLVNAPTQINSHFSDKLLKVVRDMVLHKGINRSEDHGHGSAESSRHSSERKEDFTLEFIKHICAVLALDQTVQHDVLVRVSTRT